MRGIFELFLSFDLSLSGLFFFVITSVYVNSPLCTWFKVHGSLSEPESDRASMVQAMIQYFIVYHISASMSSQVISKCFYYITPLYKSQGVRVTGRESTAKRPE